MSYFEPLAPNYLLIEEASPNQTPRNFRAWSKLKKEVEISSDCNGNVLEKMATWVFTHLNNPTKMELKNTQLQGWISCNSNDERYVSITLAGGKSFRAVWRFKWCSSCREIKHSIGRNDQTTFKTHFACRQSWLIVRSHPITGEGRCYVICDCNTANIDVVAPYLSERLNGNLYDTPEKLIFQFVYIYFLSALCWAVRKKLRQMQQPEKRRKILL